MADPAVKTDQHYTYADYKDWPEDERWELIDGVAWNMCAAPSTRHQRISWALVRIFADGLDSSSCEGLAAPVDVFPLVGTVAESDTADTVVQPDLIVVCDSHQIVGRGCIGSPDIVVEILSPSTMSKDLSIKRDLYERAGVKEFWVVSPKEEAVLVFRLGEDGRFPLQPEIYDQHGVATSRVVPTINVDLEKLFAAVG